MLKLIFDKHVNLKKKKINTPKVQTLEMARYIQIICLSTWNLKNQRNVSHLKLSKYCDIDAHLDFSMHAAHSTCQSCGVLYTGYAISIYPSCLYVKVN